MRSGRSWSVPLPVNSCGPASSASAAMRSRSRPAPARTAGAGAGPEACAELADSARGFGVCGCQFVSSNGVPVRSGRSRVKVAKMPGASSSQTPSCSGRPHPLAVRRPQAGENRHRHRDVGVPPALVPVGRRARVVERRQRHRSVGPRFGEVGDGVFVDDHSPGRRWALAAQVDDHRLESTTGSALGG